MGKDFNMSKMAEICGEQLNYKGTDLDVSNKA